MGTNYFAVRNRPSVEEPIHIGKSSIGWLFCFQEQNEKYTEPPVIWHTYNQIKDWLKKYTVDDQIYVIMNEYDEIVSYDDFIEMVDYKQKDEFCKTNPDNFDYGVKNIDGYRFRERWFG